MTIHHVGGIAIETAEASVEDPTDQWVRGIETPRTAGPMSFKECFRAIAGLLVGVRYWSLDVTAVGGSTTAAGDVEWKVYVDRGPGER
jgi:hypothetical protein